MIESTDPLFLVHLEHNGTRNSKSGFGKPALKSASYATGRDPEASVPSDKLLK